MRTLSLLLIAGLVLLAGCVKFHSIIDIGPDGSGTCTMSYGMTKSVAEAITEMNAMSPPGGGGNQKAPTLDDFDRADMEKRAKENGVTIKKFEQETVDGRDTLEIELAFKDVTGLSRVLQQSGDGTVMAIFRDGAGNYVLTSIPDPNPPAPVEEEEPTPEATGGTPGDPAKMMQIMGKLMQSIEELDVRFEIKVPGEILSSSAPTVEGRNSVWSINAANMMEMQDTSMEPKITFAKEGVKIDAPVQPE